MGHTSYRSELEMNEALKTALEKSALSGDEEDNHHLVEYYGQGIGYALGNKIEQEIARGFVFKKYNYGDLLDTIGTERNENVLPLLPLTDDQLSDFKIRLADHIFAALDYLHQGVYVPGKKNTFVHVIHRDVKPENIFVDVDKSTLEFNFALGDMNSVLLVDNKSTKAAAGTPFPTRNEATTPQFMMWTPSKAKGPVQCETPPAAPIFCEAASVPMAPVHSFDTFSFGLTLADLCGHTYGGVVLLDSVLCEEAARGDYNDDSAALEEKLAVVDAGSKLLYRLVAYILGTCQCTKTNVRDIRYGMANPDFTAYLCTKKEQLYTEVKKERIREWIDEAKAAGIGKRKGQVGFVRPPMIRSRI
eukprot:g2141.t1